MIIFLNIFVIAVVFPIVDFDFSISTVELFFASRYCCFYVSTIFLSMMLLFYFAHCWCFLLVFLNVDVDFPISAAAALFFCSLLSLGIPIVITFLLNVVIVILLIVVTVTFFSLLMLILRSLLLLCYYTVIVLLATVTITS